MLFDVTSSSVKNSYWYYLLMNHPWKPISYGIWIPRRGCVHARYTEQFTSILRIANRKHPGRRVIITNIFEISTYVALMTISSFNYLFSDTANNWILTFLFCVFTRAEKIYLYFRINPVKKKVSGTLWPIIRTTTTQWRHPIFVG